MPFGKCFPSAATCLICLFLCSTFRELLGLEGASWDDLDTAPAPSMVSYSRLPRNVSSWVFNKSAARHSKILLGNVCHCFKTLTVNERGFFLLELYLLHFCVWLLPFLLSLDNTEKCLSPPSLFPIIRDLYINMIPPKLLQAKQFQFSASPLYERYFSSLIIFLFNRLFPVYLCLPFTGDPRIGAFLFNFHLSC